MRLFQMMVFAIRARGGDGMSMFGDGSPKNNIFDELENIFEDEYGITDDSKTAFIFDVLEVLKCMFDER